MIKNIFREYDIRGIFQQELCEDIVKKIGYYFGLEVLKKIPNAKYIAIGYDARTHSTTLKNWLTSGLKYANLEVLDMQLVPTPVNYFANWDDEYPIVASIMITGSHNPPQYNGFKITLDKKPFFADDIYKLGDIVLKSNIQIPNNEETIFIDTKNRYIDYIVDKFSHLNLNQTFVFDCGNGVASVVLKDILDRLNIKYKLLYDKPDGTFPNHHPDPSEEKNLQDIKQELKTNNYALGFAYDGDADRVAVLSQKYNFKGDILAMFFSKFIKDPVVIGEVKCSQIMYDTINQYGKAIMYKTGHSNLKVKIAQTNASLAAEVSGHIFFNDRYFGYDDAIYATFRTLELLNDDFDFDSEYEKLPQLYATDENTISTTEDKKFEIIKQLEQKLKNPPKDFPKIVDIITIDGLRVVFENGWGLVRASNTTPKLVTRFEATDQQTALLYQTKLLELIL
jgi:phosphomannomutase/phosphoglucomutase